MPAPRILGRQASVRDILLINAVTVAAVVGLLFAVATVQANVGTQSLQPSGTVRIGSASASSTLTFIQSDGERTLLSVPFKVASGKVADVFAFFQGFVSINADSGFCRFRFRLDNATSGFILDPGAEHILDGSSNTIAATSVQAQLNGLVAGSHTIFATADTVAAPLVNCSYQQRSLVLIANLR